MDKGMYALGMREGCFRIIAMLLVLLSGAQHALADHYEVAYLGRAYDAASDQTTFSYRVSGTGIPPALSHFVAGLPQCDPALEVVSGSPQFDEVQTDPTSGTYGIKWDFGIGENDVQDYSYTIAGNIPEGIVRLSLKAGQFIEHTELAGPACPGGEQCLAGDCNLGDESCINGETETQVVPPGQKCTFRGSIRNVGSISASPAKLTISGQSCSAEEVFLGCGESEWTVSGCGAGDVVWSANDTSFLTITEVSCCDERVGQACSAGLGICAASGTIQCDGSCSAEPGDPNPEGEICGNGLDDDCDGEVDEQTCVGGEDTEITLTASDGTFEDHVLVEWTEDPNAASCELYRSETADELGQLLASGLTGLEFQDISAVPDTDYYYTLICDTGISSNQDLGFRPGQADRCSEGEECAFDELEPHACANANGFLGQINIATVINRHTQALPVRIEYRDLQGIVRGSISTNIEPLRKVDFIINDLGLEADTYGTVCVDVDTTLRGVWSGGIALYKTNTRSGAGTFGSDFDFVLYYPFTNPRTGAYTLPLNTYRLGVRADSVVANWIRITDAVHGDGEGLKGTLFYVNDLGQTVKTERVDLPDGGRFDFDGHLAIGGPQYLSGIGLARFVPDTGSKGEAAEYYISTGRYFYDCAGSGCTDFYTAFILPNRPATSLQISGGISTANGELSVLELNNIGDSSADIKLDGFQENGQFAATQEFPIAAMNTRHVIVNKVGATGILADNSVGSAQIQAMSGMVSAISIFYKLDDAGRLEYAYAAPLLGDRLPLQISEFNSFIGNENTTELFNTQDTAAEVQLIAHDSNNNPVFSTSFSVPAKSTLRSKLALPADTYGTLMLQSTSPGLVFRNYVSREDEYVLTFSGQ